MRINIEIDTASEHFGPRDEVVLAAVAGATNAGSVQLPGGEAGQIIAAAAASIAGETPAEKPAEEKPKRTRRAAVKPKAEREAALAAEPPAEDKPAEDDTPMALQDDAPVEKPVKAVENDNADTDVLQEAKKTAQDMLSNGEGGKLRSAIKAVGASKVSAMTPEQAEDFLAHVAVA